MTDSANSELRDIEKRIINELGGDLSVGPRPFADLGLKVGLAEEEVVKLIRSFQERGLLRRFGATLRHQKSGYTANAMVAWRVSQERISEVGEKLASFPEVTHCYQRRTAPGWSKNLYTMIHAASEEECFVLVERLARAAVVEEYELLFSHQELKKTSMRYFNEKGQFQEAV